MYCLCHVEHCRSFQSLKGSPRKGSTMNHLAQKEAVNTGQARGTKASWLPILARVLLPHHRSSCHLNHHSRLDSWEVCQGFKSGQTRRSGNKLTKLSNFASGYQTSRVLDKEREIGFWI